MEQHSFVIKSGPISFIYPKTEHLLEIKKERKTLSKFGSSILLFPFNLNYEFDQKYIEVSKIN